MTNVRPSDEQQKRVSRTWGNVNGENVASGALSTLETGTPFGANNVNNAPSFNGVDPRPYVVNPGYLTTPDGTSTAYFGTALNRFTYTRRREGLERQEGLEGLEGGGLD